jgi:hypothetical protein
MRPEPSRARVLLPQIPSTTRPTAWVTESFSDVILRLVGAG